METHPKPACRHIVFISGPYSGPDRRAVADNIDRARIVAARLAQRRIPFICPHLNSAHFDSHTPEVPYEFWIDMCLLLLQRCDALITVSGWMKSPGAKIEVAFARQQQIPVFHGVTAVQNWYRMNNTYLYKSSLSLGEK